MIETAVILGVWGFALADILAQNGHIFSRLNVWAFENLPEWVYKPLIGCSRCIAGQSMLWFVIVYSVQNGGELFNLFQYVGYIGLSIITAHFLSNLNQFINDRIN